MPLFRSSRPTTTEDNIWRLPEQIYRVLHQLKTQRIAVRIRFTGDQEPYSSIVLDASLDKKRFLLDELIPKAGNRALHNGNEFLLEAHLNGAEISLRHLKIAGTQMHGDVVLSKVDFPECIHYAQRRSAFRVEVPPSTRAVVRLYGVDRDHPVKGRLLDLSGTGCRVRVSGTVSPPIRGGEPFGRCEIDVPGQALLTITANVRFVEPGQSIASVTFGMQFSNASPKEDRHIFKLVQSLQRLSRRSGLS